MPEKHQTWLVRSQGIVESRHVTALCLHDPGSQCVHKILAQAEHHFLKLLTRITVTLSCKAQSVRCRENFRVSCDVEYACIML